MTLATSSLYELFQAHVLQLYRFIEDDIPASAVESIGSATLELARAVIATVGHEDVARNDVANEALLTRVEAYAQQHLTDPALSPENIARTHHISVRQLYKLWSAREPGLAEWIMRGRLEGARRGRRFRAAYGNLPPGMAAGSGPAAARPRRRLGAAHSGCLEAAAG